MAFIPKVTYFTFNFQLSSIYYIHLSAGERELVEFLTEEILAERKAQKSKSIPTELDGFQLSLNGSEMTLTKKTEKET